MSVIISRIMIAISFSLFVLTSCNPIYTNPISSSIINTQIDVTPISLVLTKTPPIVQKTQFKNPKEFSRTSVPFETLNPPQTIIQTAISDKRITATPTAIPLNDNGPWLLLHNLNNETLAINPDGRGVTSLFPGISLWQLSGSLNSNIVAANTGDGLKLSSYKLYLLKLPTLDIYKEISLLSYFEKYPETFDDGPTGPLGGISGSDPTSSVAWSPDGHYLAFMGAIENPTSSLYIYDSEKDNIKKVSNNKYQGTDPIWSPDGQWIIYKEINDFHGWSTEAIWAYSMDSGKSKLLYQPKEKMDQMFIGWVGKDKLVVANYGMGEEEYIRIVNINNGNTKLLYAGKSFRDVYLDTKGGTILFFPFSSEFEDDDIIESGLYLASPNFSKPRLISTSGDLSLAKWKVEEDRFISDVECDNKPGYFISFDFFGKQICTPKSNLNKSPDGQWSAYVDSELTIYNSANEKLATFEDQANGEILWRPDSAGFFIISEEAIHYVSIPELILSNVLYGDYSFYYFWANTH